MNDIAFLLLGLANGAVFAALATALVVTYRSSGVINFASSSLALFGAYNYAYLRQGELLSLIPGTPSSFSIGRDPGMALSMLIAVALTAVLGLLLYLVVFRPLRRATNVAKSVASLGVMLVVVELIVQQVGTNMVSVGQIFPDAIWKLGTQGIGSNQVWLALTVIVIALALAALIRFTPFGLQTRAIAETEIGSYVSGISPDRVAALNWMLSSAVAALAGILIAPILPLQPTTYTLFIVPAIAAAVVGQIRYMVPAVAAGLVIGMVQSEVTFQSATTSWMPKSGGPQFVPLILILVTFVLRAKPLPSRGELLERALGRAPRPKYPARTALAGLAVLGAALPFISPTWRSPILFSLIFAMIGLSYVVVTGLTGQISLAQLGLAGVGGFSTSFFITSWHVPFPVAPILAGLTAALIGVVVGLAALRIRGLPVAVVTLTLAVALQAVWFENFSIVPANGVTITGPWLFGLDLRSRVGTDYARLQFCYLVLVVLVLCGLAVAALRRSQLGAAMLAVRANEKSAAAAGIHTVVIKLTGFAFAAFIAGVGGSMLGYFQGNLTYDTFDVFTGLALFATVYVAGITSISGGVLAGVMASGGVIYQLGEDYVSLGGWYDTISALLLILTVVLNPEGIVGPFHHKLAQRRARVHRADESQTSGHDAPAATAQLAGEREPLLTLEDVSVRYGGVVAVDEVSFSVPSAAIVGLIGPNGAGKTTLLDAICGFASATGSVTLGGKEIGSLPPYQRMRSGFGRTFQGLDLYDDLSVEENIAIGGESIWTGHRGERHASASAEAVMRLLGIEDLRDRPAGELSQGHRQLASVARALAGDPQVLLLDEPAAGLDTAASLWLGERLQAIRASGKTIFVIDHDMSFMLSICDEVHVLDFGKLIASGPPREVLSDPRVLEAYLGSSGGPRSDQAQALEQVHAEQGEEMAT